MRAVVGNQALTRSQGLDDRVVIFKGTGGIGVDVK
jgi:hypothetical protein